MKVFIVASLLAAIVSAAPSTRITGGQDAALGEFPYIVSVQWGAFNKLIPICSGSILSKKFILTSGHCVHDRPFYGEMVIIAGIDNLNDTSKGQRIDVVGRVESQYYHGGIAPNDIGILRLKNELVYNENVQPIALPDEDWEPDWEPSATALLSGWGSISTNDTEDIPDQLQKAELPLMTYEECAKVITDLVGTSEPLDSISNICTRNPGNHMSGCTGDTGGPLVRNGKVIGVASWGFAPCGFEGAPTVYTRVSSFLKFLKGQVTFD